MSHHQTTEAADARSATQGKCLVNFDESGKIVSVNRAFMSLSGYGQEIADKHIQDLFDRKDLQDWSSMDIVSAIMKDGSHKQVHVHFDIPMGAGKSHALEHKLHLPLHTLRLWESVKSIRAAESIQGSTVGHYRIQNLLSYAGSYTYAAIDTRTDTPVIFKVYDKQALPRAHMALVYREIDVMRTLSEAADRYAELHHRAAPVARLIEVSETARHVCLVIEQAGRSLAAELAERGALPEAEIRQIAVKLLRAVQWLRTHGVAHLNLDPSSILISRVSPSAESETAPSAAAQSAHYPLYHHVLNAALDQTLSVRLCDFASARFTRSERAPHFMSSLSFSAPELQLGHDFFGAEADVWSVAAVLYALVTGETQPQLLSALLDERYTDPTAASDDMRDFLRHALALDSTHRPSIETLLRHNWLRELSVSPLSTPTKPSGGFAAALPSTA